MHENENKNELSRLVKSIIDDADIKPENVIEVIKALSDLEYDLNKPSGCDVARSILYCSAELIKISNYATNRIKSVADIYDEIRYFSYPKHLLTDDAKINKYLSIDCVESFRKVIYRMDIDNIVKLKDMFAVALGYNSTKVNEDLKLKRICDIVKIKEKLESLSETLAKLRIEDRASTLDRVYQILDYSDVFNIDVDAVRIVSLCYADYDKYQHVKNHVQRNEKSSS